MTTITWFRRPYATVAFVALGVIAWLALVASVGAQTPQDAKPASPAAKAAKPTASAKKKAAPPFKMAVEPRAMDVLKATSARLAAAKSLSFTATVGYEYPSKFGPPIVYSLRYDVAMQRPNKLRIVMPGDGPASEFYYDGKTIMAFAPAENLVAVADAPPTIDDALKVAFQKAATYFPFTDLLAADPYAALTSGVKLAFYVGPSAVIGGVATDMVVWANDDVFLQAWIGVDDKLPRRLRAVFAADPLQLRHEMELSNWKIDPALSADTFTSAKAQSASRMAFASPAPPPRGAKPITMRAPKADAAKASAKSN
jgi:hypothetical protein